MRPCSLIETPDLLSDSIQGHLAACQGQSELLTIDPASGTGVMEWDGNVNL